MVWLGVGHQGWSTSFRNISTSQFVQMFVKAVFIDSCDVLLGAKECGNQVWEAIGVSYGCTLASV